MTQEYDARIRLATRCNIDLGMRLIGEVFNDTLTTGCHPFPDGTAVVTTVVTRMDGRTCTTLSGTKYRVEFADEAE